MEEAASKAAELLRNASHVTVVSHIDADGITAGSLASLALDDSKISHEVIFIKKLDSAFADELRAKKPETVWFTDLGSGSTDVLGGLKGVISDHHKPLECEPKTNGKKKTLFDYDDSGCEDFIQVNPHMAGRDGGTDISGAGTAYLVARAMNPELRRFAHLAIIGAVGDMQDRENGRLTGTNRQILVDALDFGVLEVEEDVNLFGRETRPIWKMLQYASDLNIDGVTDDYRGSMEFFMGLGINLKKGENWRAWVDMKKSERKLIISALEKLVPRDLFIGEVYLFPLEKKATELHEAKECATLLNSCGRYDAAKLGMDVCKGDRDESLDLALGLRKGHRRQLIDSLKIMEATGISQMEYIQFVHVGSMIRDTIVGTVAGMLFGSGKIDDRKPIFALAEADDGIKISGRGTRILVNAGLDLSEVMRQATQKLGGAGGGHNIAAGATISPENVNQFLEMANEIVGQQLS
ncbi:MAG: DHH family phosphoesterase [Thermoplasmata archaeon]|nr:DHH family phosphoesterase [Thermoplasmata archaeon]